MQRGLERQGLYSIPDVHVWRGAESLQKFIAPGSIVKGSWPGGMSVLLCTPSAMSPLGVEELKAAMCMGTWPQDVVVWKERPSSHFF